MKFGVTICTQTWQCSAIFVKIGSTTTIFYLGTSQVIYLYFQYFLAIFGKFGAKDFHIILLNDNRLHENQPHLERQQYSTYCKYIYWVVSKFIRASVTADVFENDGKLSAAHAQCFSFLQTCPFATTQTVRYSVLFLNLVHRFLTGEQHRKVHKEDTYR